MKKSQLIDALAARFDGNKKAAAEALDAVVDTITREVAKGEQVVIKGFGTFERVLSKGAGKGSTKGKKAARKSFVPEFVPGKELIGVVTGKLPLPAMPKLPMTSASRRSGTPGPTPEVPADVEPVTKPAEPAATKSAPTTGAKKAPGTRTAARETAAKKTTGKKATGTKSAATKAGAAKAAGKKTTAKKTTTKKTTTAKKSPATKKTATKSAPGSRSASTPEPAHPDRDTPPTGS